jgi:hypothetical protein
MGRVLSGIETGSLEAAIAVICKRAPMRSLNLILGPGTKEEDTPKVKATTPILANLVR